MIYRFIENILELFVLALGKGDKVTRYHFLYKYNSILTAFFCKEFLLEYFPHILSIFLGPTLKIDKSNKIKRPLTGMKE